MSDRPLNEAFRREPFPRERRLVLDTLSLGRRKAMMHGYLALEVTAARRLLRAHRERTGDALSFTAFVLGCVGRAVAAHPRVHALRDWRGRLVMFEDVDVSLIIEVEVEGRPFAFAHVVRAANRRSLMDLHQEIRTVQTGGIGALPSRTRAAAEALLRLPGPLRRLAYAGLLRSPAWVKRHTGTVLLSAIGMFGGGAGWGVSAPGLHGLSLVVGGIERRPPLVGTEPDEFLCLTLSADHAIVDGAPLARFARDLRERVESAEGCPLGLDVVRLRSELSRAEPTPAR